MQLMQPKSQMKMQVVPASHGRNTLIFVFHSQELKTRYKAVDWSWLMSHDAISTIFNFRIYTTGYHKVELLLIAAFKVYIAFSCNL